MNTFQSDTSLSAMMSPLLMVLQPAYDKYGQNQQHPNYQQQTQIRWYDATFAELLTIVGLNKQTSLSMQ